MILFSFIFFGGMYQHPCWYMAHNFFVYYLFLHHLLPQYGDIIHHHSTHSPALKALRRMHLQ